MLDSFNSGSGLKPSDELFTVQSVQAFVAFLMTVGHLTPMQRQQVRESMAPSPGEQSCRDLNVAHWHWQVTESSHQKLPTIPLLFLTARVIRLSLRESKKEWRWGGGASPPGYRLHCPGSSRSAALLAA